MGCSLLASIFASTIPTMKKLSEMYKLYRELPIFQALYQSMLELGQQELLPLELMPIIVHTYDQTVVDMIRDSQEQFNLTGKLVMYRILNRPLLAEIQICQKICQYFGICQNIGRFIGICQKYWQISKICQYFGICQFFKICQFIKYNMPISY